MPQAAIIIPHYNDVPRLMRCLEALAPQLTEDTELLVVDNNSTETLAPVRAAFPDLRLVTETRAGAAEARNRGVAETTAPRLFFIDADCVPAEDWVAAAFAVCDSADVVGGEITVFDETPPPRSGAEAFERVFAFHNRDYIENKGFSVTANLLTTRAVFETVGPFDPGVSEDFDWCQRATAKGYRLAYAGQLRVAHPARADWPALRKKWRRLTHESFGVNGAGPVARFRWALRALALPVTVLLHAPRVFRHPDLAGPGERWAALGILARLRLQRMVWMFSQVLRGHALGR